MSLDELAWTWTVLGAALLLGVGVRWVNTALDSHDQKVEEQESWRRIAFIALLLLVVAPIVGGTAALVWGGGRMIGPPNDWSDLVLYVILVLAGGIIVVRAMPPGRMRRLLKRGLIAAVIGLGVGVGALLVVGARTGRGCGGLECSPVATIGSALWYAALVVGVFLEEREY